MPKIFDRQFERLYQPRRLNEDVWFVQFQKSILWLANTNIGRDILGIHKDFPRIVEISKRHITGVLEGDKLISEFRVGSKYANTIRLRWEEFCNAMQWYQPVIGMMFFNTPVLSSKNRYTTGTFYPDPNVETTTVDGNVLEQYSSGGTQRTWAQIIGGSGTTATDNAASGEPIYITSNTTSNRWRRNARGIYLFDTSSIDDTATVDSATFSIWCTDKTDTLGITKDMCVYGSTPASNTALATSDYAQTGSTAYSSAVAQASVNVGSYTDISLNATGISNISLTSVTKLALKNANYDVAAVDPSWSSNTDSYYTCYFADQTGTTNDPKLTVVYTVSSVSTSYRLLILGVG